MMLSEVFEQLAHQTRALRGMSRPPLPEVRLPVSSIEEFLTRAGRYADWLGLSSTSTLLSTLRLDSSTGLFMLGAAVRAGSSIVLAAESRVEALPDLVRNRGVTSIVVYAGELQYLVRMPVHEVPLSSWPPTRCVGDRLDPQTAGEAARMLGTFAIEFWSDPQGGEPISELVALGSEGGDPASRGTVLPWLEVEVRSIHGAADGGIGELWVSHRSENRWRACGTSAQLIGDRRLRVGDPVADLLPGLQPEPSVVERLLCRHPKVHEAAVVSDGDGRLVAHIVKRPGTELDAGALPGELQQIGSAIPNLHRIVVLPTLPRDSTGALCRSALRH